MKPKREFDPAEQVEVIINFIKEYFANNGTPQAKAVIGISGGKDSTIAAALLVRALGADRVIGVMMPEFTQSDISDAQKVCDILGIEAYHIDIGAVAESVYKSLMPVRIATTKDAKVPPVVSTNTPARIRMTTLYAVAALVGGRVCNTGNASEKFIGYTTKYGDLAGDFALFTELTVREIYAIGDYLSELPHDLVHKIPADGMSGKTDEDNTGIPYNAVDDFLLEGKLPNMEIYEKMIAAHKRNVHKECINLPHPYRTWGHLHNAAYREDAWCF